MSKSLRSGNTTPPISADSSAVINAISRLEAKIDKQSSDLREILDKQMIELRTHVDEKISNAVSELSRTVGDKTENLSLRISAIEKKTEYVENRDRAKDVLIYGIPFTSQENVYAIFGKIAFAIGFTQSELQHQQYIIDTLFRLSHNATTNNKGGTTNPSPILLKFTSLLAKNDFMTNYYKFGNLNLSHVGFQSTDRIYINVSLSKSNRLIYNRARKLKKDGLISKIKIKSGLVFVVWKDSVKLAKISSISEFDSYISQYKGTSNTR